MWASDGRGRRKQNPANPPSRRQPPCGNRPRPGPVAPPTARPGAPGPWGRARRPPGPVPGRSRGGTSRSPRAGTPSRHHRAGRGPSGGPSGGPARPARGTGGRGCWTGLAPRPRLGPAAGGAARAGPPASERWCRSRAAPPRSLTAHRLGSALLQGPAPSYQWSSWPSPRLVPRHPRSGCSAAQRSRGGAHLRAPVQAYACPASPGSSSGSSSPSFPHLPGGATSSSAGLESRCSRAA